MILTQRPLWKTIVSMQHAFYTSRSLQHIALAGLNQDKSKCFTTALKGKTLQK